MYKYLFLFPNGTVRDLAESDSAFTSLDALLADDWKPVRETALGQPPAKGKQPIALLVLGKGVTLEVTERIVPSRATPP
jgi:hypothetical protein